MRWGLEQPVDGRGRIEHDHRALCSSRNRLALVQMLTEFGYVDANSP